MLLYNLVVLLILSDLCDSYKILLVFPVPGRSHAILGEGYVRHLLNDGHEVTYITPILMNNTNPRLRQIDVSSNYKLMPTDELFDIEKVLYKEFDFKDIRFMLYVTTDFANGTITHPNVQNLIQDSTEHFDAVIVEWLYSELYAGFSTVFNCPLIWSSSLEPHALVLELIDDVLNPAYSPQHLSNLLPPYNFWGRVQELWALANAKIFQWRLRHKENRIFNNAFASSVAKRGRTLPAFYEVKYNGSLMLGNSHVSVGTAISLPQNYIPIGGYHINEHLEPLPAILQKVADDARNGFIYFSMGSMLKSSRIPREFKNGLIEIFGRLNQTIIWKFEEEFPNLPNNIHIVSWAPQLSILAHPNCKLFITHGGLLSILESLHFGIPIIGIPMFGDQHLNINRVVEKGFAKRVDLNKNVAINMDAAIKEILQNPSFLQKVKEYSHIYHDRLVPPGKQLTHWVSHVIRTNGAHHLRSPAKLVTWYQKMYLDLVLLILITLYVTVKILMKMIKQLLVIGKRLMRFKQKNM